MCRMNIGSKNKDLYFFLMLHIFTGVIVEIKKIIYIQKYIINIIAKCYDNMYMHIHREHSEHILSINEDFLSFIMWLCSFAWKFCTTLITYNQLARTSPQSFSSACLLGRAPRFVRIVPAPQYPLAHSIAFSSFYHNMYCTLQLLAAGWHSFLDPNFCFLL